MLIAFDLDGTLIDAEPMINLGKRKGVEREMTDVTKKSLSGKIDFKEGFQKRINLLRGLDMNVLYGEIDKLKLMSNALECIQILKENNIKTVILTGIFDVLAEKFHQKFGTDYLLCNKLIVKDNKLYDIEKPILGPKEKAYFFESLAKRLGFRKEQCVAVGDGANDIEYLKKAGFSIGFNAQPIIKKYVNVVVTDLRDVAKICLKIKNGNKSR